MSKNRVNFPRSRYGMPKVMVHLYHPCYVIDVTTVEYKEDEMVLRGQGYISLDEIRGAFPLDSIVGDEVDISSVDYSVIPYMEKK